MTLAGWLLTQARKVVDLFRRKPKPVKPPVEPPPTPGRGFRFPWWLPLIVLPVLLSCRMPTEAGLVAQPEAEWVAGYHEAERCSGRMGHVERVRWHVVDDSSRVMEDGHLAGYTRGDDIYLARSWAGERWIARHESLHQLGFHRHDPALFAVRCHATWGAIEDTLED
jgi:hypothetical protein